jgi:hypothetical protein
LVELSALRNRVRRQHTLGRISLPDKENLEHKLNEIEAAIMKMDERGDDHMEV